MSSSSDEVSSGRSVMSQVLNTFFGTGNGGGKKSTASYNFLSPSLNHLGIKSVFSFPKVKCSYFTVN